MSGYRLDAEWQRQQAIYMDPPGEFATGRVVAQMRAVFAMEAIEAASC